MKIDMTTYNNKEENQIGMTADQASRPDKVLFFADTHFLFFPNPQTAHLQAAQANAQPKLAKEPFFAIAQTEILTLNDTLKNK